MGDLKVLVLLWDLADGLTGCKTAEGLGAVTVLQSRFPEHVTNVLLYI